MEIKRLLCNTHNQLHADFDVGDMFWVFSYKLIYFCSLQKSTGIQDQKSVKPNKSFVELMQADCLHARLLIQWINNSRPLMKADHSLYLQYTPFTSANATHLSFTYSQAAFHILRQQQKYS